MMNTPRLPLARAGRLLFAAALGCAVLSPVQAQQADRNAPMNVEADALRYDDTRQTSVFTGNVVITKGSIVIRGQQVDVRQDPQGHQFGTVLGQGDRLAFFRQKREGLDEFIEGEAQRIDYDSQADTVKLTGQAVLRRYRGATLSDQTSGSTIFYNNRTGTFSVDGGPGSRTAVNPGGRVRATLTPNPTPGSATPAPPTALQPSSRLEPRQ